MPNTELAFEQRINQMIEDAKAIGYNPTYFTRMVHELGAINACKSLVTQSKPSEGLSRLWQEHRLDLTVESIILEPEWIDLFSENERAIARAKLTQLNQ